MKKRLISAILLLVILAGAIPMTASAEETYVVGYNVTVPNINVPTDGSNPYCKCNIPVGDRGHWCCWQYGHKVHYYIWGVYPNRDNPDTLYLRNVPDDERTLIVEHLKEYLKDAAPGALFRMDKSSDPTTGDNSGHTMVFVGMNSAGDGAFFLEGNYDGRGQSRLYEWSFANLVKSYGAGSRHEYQYIKYIAWPNAPEYTSCEHSYEGAGLCSKCGREYRVTINTADSGIYEVVKQFEPYAESPYDVALRDSVSFDIGAKVDVTGSMLNAFGERWYKISYGNDKAGFVRAEFLSFVEAGEQEIACSITSPAEGEIVPQQAYPVAGMITSKYPLEVIEAYLDGKLYASVPGYEQYYVNIRNTEINHSLSFSSLAPGKHELIIKAQDIHRNEPTIIITRNFEIEQICDHSNAATNVVPPRCTEQGYTGHSCECGYSYTDSYKEALGHDMGDWVTTKTPTTTIAGERKRQCKREECDYTETEHFEIADGWWKENNKWYYYRDGEKLKNEWVRSDGRWYYMNEEGVMATGWIKVDGRWYLMSSGGHMLTGWQKTGGKWYFLNSHMRTGWIQSGGIWYYMDSSGAMQTGWKLVSGKWYYMDSSGAMQTDWEQINGKWYYLGNDGAMRTGWIYLGGKWYYLNTSGEMVTGAQIIDGKTYVFSASGIWTA